MSAYETIAAGDTVTVEETRGMAAASPVTRTVTGVVALDDEGTPRVDGVPVWRDEDGYLPFGVLLISHTPNQEDA